MKKGTHERTRRRTQARRRKDPTEEHEEELEHEEEPMHEEERIPRKNKKKKGPSEHRKLPVNFFSTSDCHHM